MELCFKMVKFHPYFKYLNYNLNTSSNMINHKRSCMLISVYVNETLTQQLFHHSPECFAPL